MVLSVALGSSPPTLVLVDMLLDTHSGGPSAGLQGSFSVQSSGVEGVEGREIQELSSKGTVNFVQCTCNTFIRTVN